MSEAFVYNRLAAAEQDHELAKAEKREALAGLDSACQDSVLRVRAAQARVELARGPWLESAEWQKRKC